MNNRSSYWQLIPYIRPQITTITQALACTLLYTVFWPILAQLAGKIANSIGQGDINTTAKFALAAAVAFLLQGIVQYGQDTLMAKAALKIALDLRQVVYTHLQRLSLNYFAVAKTGDLTYRITEEIDRIGEVVNNFFHQFVPCILQLIVVLGYLFYLNWQLTLATLLVAPLMAVLIGAFGEQLLKFSRRSQTKISNLSSFLTEVFSGIRLVKALAAEEYTIAKFAQEAEENRQAQLLAEKVKAIQFVVVGFLEALSVIFLFFLGSWQISRGNLTGSEFVSYVAGVALLINPISITTANYNQFKQGQASIDRIVELLAIKAKIREKSGAIELPKVTGKVEYCQVKFSYNSTRLTLQDINLIAQPGETIALVGESGAGKSTLVNLLPRFYDLDHGKILIDGINIQDVTLKSLRKQIGIVPQETLLFSGTIAQNIAFGQTEFDLQQVEAAAKVANAHQLITALSQGY